MNQKNTLRNSLIVFGLWSGVGILFVVEAQLAFAYSGKVEVPLGQSIVWEMGGWYLWALFSPLIIWLAKRFPTEQPRLPRNLLIHLGCGVILAAMHILLHYQLLVLYDRTAGTSDESMASVFAMALVTRFAWRLMVYFVIMIVYRAFYTQRKLREEEKRAAQLQVQLANAQLQALKMQLHPHFLFNTLQSISELMHEDLRAADQMIARLGEFLRLTLQSTGTQEISLKEELHFLKCFLEIEQVRFKDRLQTVIHAEPGVMDARVPNLILQPVVENAIRHGIAQTSGAGTIEVSATRSNGMLRLLVRDTGPGLKTMNQDGLLQKGVGLSNTVARLEQLYGSNYRFHIQNGEQNGLMVTIEIPAHRFSAEELRHTK